jgi:hypothetical protein
MAGDFNFHINDSSDPAASCFLQLLETFNLKQHVREPTHGSGNTLDLVITRADENIAHNFMVFDPALSDHSAVWCTISIPKTAFERKEICYRKLKSIDMLQLRNDITCSALASPAKVTGDHSNLVHQYNSVLTDLLEKHAPLKKSTIIIRPTAMTVQ